MAYLIDVSRDTLPIVTRSMVKTDSKSFWFVLNHLIMQMRHHPSQPQKSPLKTPSLVDPLPHHCNMHVSTNLLPSRKTISGFVIQLFNPASCRSFFASLGHGKRHTHVRHDMFVVSDSLLTTCLSRLLYRTLFLLSGGNIYIRRGYRLSASDIKTLISYLFPIWKRKTFPPFDTLYS